MQGPLSEFVNQAADTFDGNGDSFRNALRELSQTAGRLGDSRTDLFGTVRNLQVLVNALSNSNEQIVQFSNHVASVSQVLADSSKDLDVTLGTLNQALGDVKGFLNKNNEALIGQVGKLADFTKILTDHSDDIEQILHITPNGLANFYNIYNPAQGTVGGLLSLPNFANPVQFICGGTFDIGANPDNYKRAEICRQRMGPVFKRIAMNYPPLLFHPINSITAYKGQIIYDTPETEAKAQTPVPYLQWQPAPGRDAPDAEPGRHAQRPDPAAARRGRADLARRTRAGPAADGCGPAARPRAAAAAARGRSGRMTPDTSRRRDAPARRHGLALGSGVLLLAGCQFGGLNSLDMPGTAGHGSGSYTITVELPDVATLPQNSPVMIDDVTVGSVSGIEAMQRPDGTFFAAVKLSLDGERQPARRTRRRRSRRPRCSALSTSNSPRRSTSPSEGKLKDGSNIPLEPDQPLPDHRRGALRRSASW